jgi:hypothetical protein
MEHLALRAAELEMELQRLRGEIVGTFASVGIAMLESDPCRAGEVGAAIRRLAYERDLCAMVGSPTPQFNNPLAAMAAANIRDRVLHDLVKKEAGAA